MLRVDAIHQDVPFTRRMTAAVRREIEDLARWLDLDLTLPAEPLPRRLPFRTEFRSVVARRRRR